MRLVLDWDGTVTERDTLHMAIERFGDLEVFHALERQIGRELTLNEVIEVEMGTISAPFDEVLEWLLETVTIRPGFAELVAEHDPLIISAGFRELILPVLEREGRRAEVIANSLEPSAAGWRSTFLERDACAVCGEPCKRVALAGSGPFAYVGDGVSDRCVSLAADRVFARDGLARWLDAQWRRLRGVRRPPRCPALARGSAHGVTRTLRRGGLPRASAAVRLRGVDRALSLARHRSREPLAGRWPAPGHRRPTTFAWKQRRVGCGSRRPTPGSSTRSPGCSACLTT